MAQEILGLPSSAKFAAEGDRFYNHRRKILHLYPRGNCPLTGILSQTPEEPTNDSIMFWYEKRYRSPQSTMRGTARVTTDAPSTGDADDGSNVTNGAKNTTTDFYIKVASTVDFAPGHILIVPTQEDIQFYVTAVTRGVTAPALLGYLKVRLVRAVTFGTIATIFASGTAVKVVGSAFGEGASGTGKAPTAYKRPYQIQNTTQIFSDIFKFPGSVLQMAAKWDKTGFYNEKKRDTLVDHMTSIERALIWGRRSTQDRASFDTTQEDLSVRTFSGIIEFLELWDAGSTGLQVDGQTYAPYGFKTASTLDTDDQKRIITNATGNITVDKWNDWAERVGRYHTNKSNEKLVLCGSGAIKALVKMFRMNTSFEVSYNDSAYGLEFHTLKTPFGKFHFITHPLFNEDPIYRFWALILDIHSLHTRPLRNRDTRLLKNRQNNGDDFRKDEYLTEIGFEFWAPEQHMLIKNVVNYVERE